MLFCFDFHQFAHKIAGSYLVQDIWGDTKDIREIDVILTAVSYTHLDVYKRQYVHKSIAIKKTTTPTPDRILVFIYRSHAFH